MIRHILLLSTLILLFGQHDIYAQDKPNVLWLTCEDMSDFYLSCYGGTSIETPNLDAFAARGLKYTQAYSCGAQCSPARTTLVTGCYASSLGGEWHRADRALPKENYWTPYLTAAGYYCASKGKMVDFNANNTLPDDLWHDEKSYLNAPANTPWFSILNFYPTHMSSITDYPIGERKNRTVSPNDVVVPAYVPDIDSIRDDLAWHLEFVKNLDVWFGQQLKALADAGEAENTIIFFFSDHGGSLPNSKGYLNNGGTKVPFIVYFPEKWKHLAPVNSPAEISNRVGFVDFGPTVLSLAGIDPPEVFQGKAFLGSYAETADDYVYLFKANQGINYIPSRGITNGRIKLIWNYNTAFPAGSRQDFQWKMPGYRGWELAWREGELPEPHNHFWEPQQALELYDLAADPHEGNNLANDPLWADTLVKYKTLLQQKVRDSKDLGFFPKSMRDYNSTTDIFYNWIRTNHYDIERSIAAAEFASTATPDDVDSLLSMLRDHDQVVRYWGSLGFFQLAKRGSITQVPDYLKEVMNNEFENVEVRLNCASALVYVDEFCNSLDLILSEYLSKNSQGRSYMQSIEDKARPVARQISDFVNNGNKSFYDRSALINTGAIPYTNLLPTTTLPHSDTTIYKADSLLRQCSKNNDCGKIIINDNFDNNILPVGWTEQNTTDKVTVVNQQLQIDFSTPMPTAIRNFEPLAGTINISFDFMCERNWFMLPMYILSKQNDTIATLIFGNSADKAIMLVTPNGNVNLLNETFIKNAFYNVSIHLNTKQNTIGATVNGILIEEALNVPLLDAADSISTIIFHFKSMYDNSKRVVIDNFMVKEDIDKTDFILALTEAWSLLSGQPVGNQPGSFPMASWDQLSTDFYFYYPMLNHCEYSATDFENAAAGLNNSIDSFNNSKIPGGSYMPDTEAKNSSAYVIFPTFFRPDIDEKLQHIIAYDFTSYNCSIYNLMGQKVFSSSHPNNLWDGYQHNVACPSGMYLWTLTAVIDNQVAIKEVGKIILINQ